MTINRIKEFCQELEQVCQLAYEEGVTMEQAERLAARCLQAQIFITGEIQRLDLDSRMRKNGVKATRAQIYLEAVEKYEKKPSDSMLESIVNTNDLTKAAQKAFDMVDTEKETLSLYFEIFKDAHVFFRSVSRGRYE